MKNAKIGFSLKQFAIGLITLNQISLSDLSSIPVIKTEAVKPDFTYEIFLKTDSVSLIEGYKENVVCIVPDKDEPVKAKPDSRIEVAMSRTAVARAEGPSFEEKRKLVQNTAEKYNIDWKILEAVWQIETGKSWDTSKRSYAGATGPMQFMPGTFKRYAQDGDGDGDKSVTDAKDAIASAANYLAVSGASSGNIDKALFAYNHSSVYVAKVKKIVDSIN